MYFHNSISTIDMQDNCVFEDDQILVDTSSTGKDRKWRERKRANELLANAYDVIDENKAARLRDCARVLSYRVYSDGTKRLDSINSCRVRLCPICTWRRSLKAYYTTQHIIDYLDKQDKYSYVFLTLTMRNCSADKLCDSLDLIFKSWNRFMQLADIKRAVKGWYRGIEVTHNCDYDSENYDTYHPHIHCILVVNKSYFTSRDYLSQAKISELWAQSARLDYIPICDIRKVKGNYKKAVAELSKYSAKPKDYIIPDDWDLTIKTVSTLDVALANRRLVAYGGLMKEVNKLLKLDDVDSGNLLDVGDNATKADGDYFVESYFWYSGYRQYYKLEK